MKGVVLFSSMDILLRYLDQLCEIQKQDIQISCLRNGLENVQSAISSSQSEISNKEMELREGISKRETAVLSTKVKLDAVRAEVLKLSGLLGQYESQLRMEKRRLVISLLERGVSNLIDKQEQLKKELDLLTEEITKGEQEAQALIASQAEVLKQFKDIVSQRVDSLKSKEVELFLKLNDLVESRGKQIALLPQEVVGQYEAMKLSAGGVAIAEGSGGACSACHFQIRPQILIQLEASRSFNLCENCGRILWIPRES